jgi:crotonobetainyl-CoA:carnitine CoA-transferase CaiB-like acyl-CoA transferase
MACVHPMTNSEANCPALIHHYTQRLPPMMISEGWRMQPLKGLKVLDFCWVAVGPMTTAHLAEYGATVIRIESTRRPDPLRRSPRWGDGR